MVEMFHKIHGIGLIEDREAFLVEYARGKDILHLGCVDSGLLEQRLETDRLLHKKLMEVGTHVVGVDIDAKGIEEMSNLGFKYLIVGNVEEGLDLNEKFDVIIAGEILEHLSNPGRFLEKVPLYLKPAGELIITVPNAFCIVNIMRLFKHIETVHEDHVYYFSPRTIKVLLERHGLEVIGCCGYSDTRRLSGTKLTAKRLMNRLVLTRFPEFSEGLILRCGLRKL